MAPVIMNAVLLLCICIGLQHAAELKKYEIFTGIDKSKWIQVSQLEQIFSSIEESLREMNEKQKRDNSIITQVSNNIQSINIRLQGIEEQLTRVERAETYNKVQLQHFSDGSIKEELQIDHISHRLEKNQQQLNQRLNDVDSNLETILKIQDVMEKEIRKITVAQSTLTDNVDELSQHTKQQSTKILQNITNTQQELHQKLKDSMKSSPSQEEKIRIITAADLGKNATNPVKSSQNDDTQVEWLTSLFNVENKMNEVKNQVQSMDINLQECTEIANKIYNKLDHQRNNLDSYMKDHFNLLFDQIKQQNKADLNELEGKLKKNLDRILDEQVSFKHTCHRLQLHEEQMEDKAVEILDKLFTYIDNRTYEIEHEIKNLAIHEAKLFENKSAFTTDWKPFVKVDEKLKPTENGYNTNLTQNDAARPLQLFTRPDLNQGVKKFKTNLDGTNKQSPKMHQNQFPVVKKLTFQELLQKDELLQKEEPEKLYLADEPQESSVSLPFSEKVKSSYIVQSVNAAPERIPAPESFFGIEGLSRKAIPSA